MTENDEVVGGGAELFDKSTKERNFSHLADKPDN